MSYIYPQWISNNQTLSGGKIFIGAAGTNPVDSPISVYTDPAFTESISTPVDLDFDGMPIDVEGNRLSLYFNADYTMQIKDKYGANFFLNYTEHKI